MNEAPLSFTDPTNNPDRPMTHEERRVILASSMGTVFEWYDFYVYGSLAVIIARHFFSGLNPTAGFIFALLTFAAGFAVRPFGALVFGRLGDLVGRKYAFVITILIMGLSTFLVGVLPSSCVHRHGRAHDPAGFATASRAGAGRGIRRGRRLCRGTRPATGAAFSPAGSRQPPRPACSSRWSWC
ncbi:hypothetical protein CDEF62S_00710 [Castellaniella defragrans]